MTSPFVRSFVRSFILSFRCDRARSQVGLRFNPGLGSGGTTKTNVGGPASSFGIWHALAPEAAEIAAAAGLRVVRIHTHIGSGSDPAVWQKVASMSLELCRAFDDVATLNLGGGYKVARMPGEVGTDLQKVGAPVAALIDAFEAETGRALHLEVRSSRSSDGVARKEWVS